MLNPIPALQTLLGLTGLVASAVLTPETMKAVRMHDFGGPDVLHYEDVPVPTPGPGEVLVHVKAAGVNPVDWKLRDGMGKGMLKPPYTMGYDVSGTVESTDPAVTDFKKGDDVYAYLQIAKGGGYAEFAVVPASILAKKPAKADHTHAAAIPLAGLTAWQALFDQAKLKPGQTVLIHGAAGGVGHFAVQLAVWKGAHVLATASAANAEFVKGLGAERVIDYKAEKFEDIAKDVDVVFDMIGGDTLDRSYLPDFVVGMEVFDEAGKCYCDIDIGCLINGRVIVCEVKADSQQLTKSDSLEQCKRICDLAQQARIDEVRVYARGDNLAHWKVAEESCRSWRDSKNAHSPSIRGIEITSYTEMFHLSPPAELTSAKPPP